MGCVSSSLPDHGSALKPLSTPHSDIKLKNKDRLCEDVQYQDIRKKYEISGVEIGRGAWAKVFLGKCREKGETYAFKQIMKKKYPENLRVNIVREVKNMGRVEHDNIVKLYESFEDDSFLWLVMEYVEGKELFEMIVSKTQFNEKDAAHVVKQVLSALKYLHECDIVHRDLKPENLLVCKDANGRDIIKVVDFGLSKDIQTGDLATWCGTPTYVAPEVLEKQIYNSAVDMWAVGVITYILLGGQPPFQGATVPALYKKIKSCDFDFPTAIFGNITAEAHDFICKILKLDPVERLTANDALNHPWIKKWEDGEECALPALVPIERIQQLQQEEKAEQETLRADHGVDSEASAE